MTAIPGTVGITGLLAPKNAEDTHGTHEDTYGKGGFRSVSNTTERDAIPADRRKEGMWVYVRYSATVYTLESGITNGDWVEIEFSDGAGTGELVITTLAETTIDLIDDTDFTAIDAEAYIASGVGYIVGVTSTTATGNLTIILYQDTARLQPIFTMVVDLADTTTYRSSEVFGFELETTGTIYGTAFTVGVPASETFDISILATPVQSAETPTPLPSPYGDGIEDDGTGQPRVALASAGGLQFSTSKLVLKPDATAPVYPTLSASGIAITGAMTTTTSETISAKKLFDAVGSTPLATSGAPTSGTYSEGHLICDLDNVYWTCVTAGTPGTWELFSSVYETPTDLATASLTYGTSELLAIPVIGNVGTIQRLEIWGIVAAVAEYSIPFRVRIYRNKNELGRDMIWQGNGFMRQTNLSGTLNAATVDVPVNDNNVADIDEGIVIFESVSRYELGRIVARPTGQFTLDEALENASSWAADAYVSIASGWTNIPFVNTEAGVSDQQKIYLQIRHDGASTAPAITFYVKVTTHSLGVIR
jgi:hypothetical protein